MSRPIPRTVVLAVFAAASLLAVSGQVLAGNTNPVAVVVFAVLTALAMRSRPDRWVLLLLLSHLAVFALGQPPQHPIQWVGAVTVASGTGALHLLTPWLPWQAAALTVSPRAASLTLGATCAGAGAAAATAALASSAPSASPFGTTSAAAALLLIAAATTLQRRKATPKSQPR